eukprot:2832580-Alexandrium_andersonii.AAC.1
MRDTGVWHTAGGPNRCWRALCAMCESTAKVCFRPGTSMSGVRWRSWYCVQVKCGAGAACSSSSVEVLQYTTHG